MEVCCTHTPLRLGSSVDIARWALLPSTAASCPKKQLWSGLLGWAEAAAGLLVSNIDVTYSTHLLLGRRILHCRDLLPHLGDDLILGRDDLILGRECLLDANIRRLVHP